MVTVLSKRSTTSALIDMHTTWSEAVDKGKFVGVLSFDLSSAFDCIEVNTLCNKLHLYGFDETSINWIRSYLTDRMQYVQVGNDVSSIKLIIVGAPQGSVLLPTLFIILISDIDDWTDHAIITGFADDNCATVIEDTLEETINKLQHDAKNVLSFMASNFLVANEAKTTFMPFSNRK